MGAGISLVSDIENLGLLVFAGLNMIVFVSLLGKSSNHILGGVTTSAGSTNQQCVDARMRSNAFFAVAKVIVSAAALKLVLVKSLADQIIAAWFVGQGFALQSFVQSYISGIQIRSNTAIWHAVLDGKLKEPGSDKTWKVSTDQTTVFAVALEGKDEDNRTQRRIILWQEIHTMTITQ